MASLNNFSQTFFIPSQTQIYSAQSHMHSTERESKWVGWLQLFNTMTIWMTALQQPELKQTSLNTDGEKREAEWQTKTVKQSESGRFNEFLYAS